MLTATRLSGFGDARSDIIDALSPLVGRPKVEGFLNSLESRIRSEATKGAEAAIPTIKGEVKKTVQPYVIGSLALGAVGVLLGAVALRRTRS